MRLAHIVGESPAPIGCARYSKCRRRPDLPASCGGAARIGLLRARLGSGRAPGTIATRGSRHGLPGRTALHRPSRGPDWPVRCRDLDGRDTRHLGPDAPRHHERPHSHGAVRTGHAPGPVPSVRLGRYAADRASDEMVAQLSGHARRGGPARPAGGRVRRCQLATEPAAAAAAARADVQRGDARAVRPRRRRGVLSGWRAGSRSSTMCTLRRREPPFHIRTL